MVRISRKKNIMVRRSRKKNIIKKRQTKKGGSDETPKNNDENDWGNADWGNVNNANNADWGIVNNREPNNEDSSSDSSSNEGFGLDSNNSNNNAPGPSASIRCRYAFYAEPKTEQSLNFHSNVRTLRNYCELYKNVNAGANSAQMVRNYGHQGKNRFGMVKVDDELTESIIVRPLRVGELYSVCEVFEHLSLLPQVNVSLAENITTASPEYELFTRTGAWRHIFQGPEFEEDLATTQELDATAMSLSGWKLWRQRSMRVLCSAVDYFNIPVLRKIIALYLYANCNVRQSIPPNQYRAIAKITGLQKMLDKQHLKSKNPPPNPNGTLKAPYLSKIELDRRHQKLQQWTANGDPTRFGNVLLAHQRLQSGVPTDTSSTIQTKWNTHFTGQKYRNLVRNIKRIHKIVGWLEQAFPLPDDKPADGKPITEGEIHSVLFGTVNGSQIISDVIKNVLEYRERKQSKTRGWTVKCKNIFTDDVVVFIKPAVYDSKHDMARPRNDDGNAAFNDRLYARLLKFFRFVGRMDLCKIFYAELQKCSGDYFKSGVSKTACGRQEKTNEMWRNIVNLEDVVSDESDEDNDD